LDAQLLVKRVKPDTVTLLAHTATLNTGAHENTSVMGYTTFFEGSGIHHSNADHQITHDMFVNEYFLLLFYLTPDQGASEAHTSHPEQSNIRVELKFAKPLPEAITCLLYLEFDNSVLINLARNVSTDY